MSAKLRHRDHLLWPRYALGFAAILVALGCVQSSTMLGAAYDLPDNNISQLIVARAENWHGWMQKIGLADASESLADMSEKFHAIPVQNNKL